ncbi:MAG: hypothetical protein ABMA64_04660 [Myxococcota bacterium]
MALVWLVACHRGVVPDDVGASDALGGGFVEIDLGEDLAMLDELDGIELRAVSDTCGDFLRIEPAARLGRLSEEEIVCLNQSLDTAARQTTKDKISRVLLADAWAKGDTHRWMGTAARHLAEVERADPDLIYLFTFQLVQLGNPDRMDEAIHWANAALDNKHVWEGETYVKRVYGLHKVRAMAALKKWEYLESVARRDPSPDARLTADAARNETKTFAREWLLYARSADRDDAEPMRVCAMAAGTDDYCVVTE